MIGTRIPIHISIFRRAEKDGDFITQLCLFELRQVRAAVADLYTPVPNSTRRLYRRNEREAAKAKAKARLDRDEHLEAVLRDPDSSEEDRRLARMELAAVDLMFAEDDEEEAKEGVSA